MDKVEMKNRTKQFALRIMKLIDHLPKTEKGRVLANQLMRCGTSVGANYRAACRGRSEKEFIAKLGTVLEEADESAFWIELIGEGEGEVLPMDRLEYLHKEADEICAIIFSTIRTTREK
jgi:four helix bundle protein